MSHLPTEWGMQWLGWPAAVLVCLNRIADRERAVTSPTRAQNVPSLICALLVNVCDALLSSELVKAITSCGFSKPC
jgi:hypothetical protein